MAGPCQGKGGGMGGLLFFYGANKQVENGKIEKSKQKRRIDHTGHPTADRPNSLPYYPRLWSSGTGVLSRDSLSQNGYGRLPQVTPGSLHILRVCTPCRYLRKIDFRFCP